MTTPEPNEGYAGFADPPEEAKTSREISLEKAEVILDKKWGENTWKERLFKACTPGDASVRG